MRNYLVIILVLLNLVLKAQSEINFDTVLKKQNPLFRMSFTLPEATIALSNEFAISKKHSFVSKAGVQTSFVKGGATDNKSVFKFYGYFSVEPRWYLNFERRIKRGKTIDQFSGTYLSLETYIHTNEFASINEKRYKDGGHYGAFFNIGIQRKRSKNWYFAGFFGISPLLTWDLNEKETTADEIAKVGLTIGYTF